MLTNMPSCIGFIFMHVIGPEKAIVLNLEVLVYFFTIVLFLLTLCFSISRQLSPLKRLVSFNMLRVNMLCVTASISEGAGFETLLWLPVSGKEHE